MIVESPAKAKTIAKFLGSNYIIEPSIGHVRDLPQGAKEIPAQYKTEKWKNLGVNVDKDFTPVYVVPAKKKEQVRKLQALIKGASELYLATDEDREGEAISWHLHELLKPKIPVHRLVFHEITKQAIQDALSHPRAIDDDLVRAQETRRIVDRLYGYEVSPLLWKKVRPRLSAGRVQSVAVRLIVTRERERMAFVSASYWDLLGKFAKQDGQPLAAGLTSVDGKKIPSAKDFDAATGKLKDPNCLLMNEKEANDLAARIRPGPFEVASVDERPFTEKPYPPFTTSTLQQEANRKLRYTAKHTMRIAQGLYENGHITYMRTDSTALAQEAVDAARVLVSSQYGKEYLPAAPRSYSTKVKNAQEAHEAIRPASHFTLPEQMRDKLSGDEFKLYDLIWKRTVACQMADAKGRRTSVVISGRGANFQVGGKTIDFAGYLRAYVEGSDDPDAELADRETILPDLAVGERLNCVDLETKGHSTAPPSRFTEAVLTRSLEELGIGRPSTYASIIDTILEREYVFKKGNALVPTWTAFAVVNLLETHLPQLVDYQFTARMEDDLDSISRGDLPQNITPIAGVGDQDAEHPVSRGEINYRKYLHSFYYGNGRPGLKTLLDHKVDEIDARTVCSIPVVQLDGSAPIVVRVGRYGPYLEDAEGKRASIPEGVAPDELTHERVTELLAQAAKAEQPLGYDPETGKPVFLKVGRFGPYIMRGHPDDEEKPKNASLLKDMKPDDVDLATALKLLQLPREVGKHPESGNPIVAYNGRFGPYIKAGDDTRSLPADLSPLEVSQEQAVALLAQPKAQRRGFGAPREPLKVVGESPVTKQPIKMFDGRYGYYVTDGETNASLPKGTSHETLSLDEALRLLADRAALGPPAKKKRGAKKTTAKKKAAPAAEAGEAAPKKKSAPAAAKKTAKKTAKKAAKKKKKATKEEVEAD